MTYQEDKHSSTKIMLVILGIVAAAIGLIILTHEAITSAINADESSKQLIKDLPCNWLKLHIESQKGRWILSSNDQYENQIYSEKCNK